MAALSVALPDTGGTTGGKMYVRHDAKGVLLATYAN